MAGSNVPLFSTSGEIAANAAENPGSVQRTETVRYFLLNIRHPDVVFGEIIREGGVFVVHKPEYIMLVFS